MTENLSQSDNQQEEQAIASLIQALEGDTRTRLSARQQLEKIGRSCIPQLIEVMHHGGRSAWEAAHLLGKWRVEQAIPMLFNALIGDDPVLGQIAVRALDQIDGQAITRTFLDTLPKAHPITQLDIIGILEKRGDASMTPALCQLLEATDSPMMQLSLIQTIGTLGDGHEYELITQFCDSDNAHVAKRANIATRLLEERHTQAYRQITES